MIFMLIITCKSQESESKKILKNFKVVYGKDSSDYFFKEKKMRVPSPGHGGSWGESFVASLGWAFWFIVGAMLLGVAIPFIVPVAVYFLGSFGYSLFIDKD